MKKLLGCIRRADTDFGMIREGDRVAVGLSGGKDSMALLKAMKLYQNFSTNKFELEAIMIGKGFTDFDPQPVQDWCDSLEIPLTIVQTNISKIVFDERKEKNPCSLCSKMRRGALHNEMKKRNLNVLALGHHLDDAINTLFMSMFYEGRMHTFSPLSYLSRKDVWMIRPMIYAEERDIIHVVKTHNVPVVKSPCPADKNTVREEMNSRMASLYKEMPAAKQNILNAMKNGDQMELFFHTVKRHK
ncbi:tRNA 2-thiocytidine(32) synthetase TtcA [Gottschalkiaceae bacterium SANA]|nr:tRNA 2-thiocytidine(32) synthetase TtcA [Gottschalkiaceae bacterium SANA]